jgi:hypothetical protein
VTPATTAVTKRIQRSRAKGSRLPRGAITVTRPGAWGNPFVIGQPNGMGFGQVKDAEHAVWLFEQWFTTRHNVILFEKARHRWMHEHLEDLRGADLACWCAPDSACHVAVYFAALYAPVNPHCARSNLHARTDAEQAMWDELALANPDLPPRRECSGHAWDDIEGAPPCTCPCHTATVEADHG